MSRFRLIPTLAQQAVLRDHCGHARYVWNLAVEQHAHWRPGRKSAPGYLEQCRQLTQARAENPWLAAGSQTVQQQALRDFSRAMAAFFDPAGAAHPVAGHPVTGHLTGAAISSIGAVATTAHRLPAAVAAPLMHSADGAFVAGVPRCPRRGHRHRPGRRGRVPGAAFALNRLANRTAPVCAGAVSCLYARNVILTMRLRILEAARRAPPWRNNRHISCVPEHTGHSGLMLLR